MAEFEADRSGRNRVRYMAVGGVLLLAGVAIGFLIGYSSAPNRPPMEASGGSTMREPIPGPIPAAEESPNDVKSNDAPSEEPPATKANPSTANPPTSPPSMNGAFPRGDISGGISSSGVPGGLAPINPIVIESPEPAAAPARYTEFTVIVAEAEVSAAHARVAELMQEAGARILLRFAHEPDRPEAGREIVAAVPPQAAGKLAEKLEAIPGAQLSDRWSGPQSQRHVQAQKFLLNAVNGLEKRVRELKLRFLDDAPDVVRSSTALEHYRGALSALKPAPADMEAIRVFIGKFPPPWG